jgi:hypothetical protein
MLKFTSLAIGVLTAISIAPSAQAVPIKVIIGVPVTPVVHPANHWQGGYYHHPRQVEYRRERELARERAARARWESKYRRHDGYIRPGYVPTSYSSPTIEYRGDNGNHYRRDR